MEYILCTFLMIYSTVQILMRMIKLFHCSTIFQLSAIHKVFIWKTGDRRDIRKRKRGTRIQQALLVQNGRRNRQHCKQEGSTHLHGSSLVLTSCEFEVTSVDIMDVDIPCETVSGLERAELEARSNNSISRRCLRSAGGKAAFR